MFVPEGTLSGYFSNVLNAIFPGRREINFYQNEFLLGTKSPIWIDQQNLWLVYSEIPHLNSVINKRAELLSLGKLRLRKIGTETEIFRHDSLTLLRKPNPLQSFSEFITQYSTFKDVYGNAILFKNNKLMGAIPGALWNLPPATIKIKPTGKIFKQIKLEDIIDGYIMMLAGETTVFKPSEIILKNDNVGSEYLKSQSKIISLVKPLSNIAGALQTANIMIHDHGAYGILSNSAKEDGGAIPLGTEERARIEGSENEKYGNKPGQRRRIVTNSSVTYQPMSFPIKDMMLFEEIEQDFGMVLDAYGVDRDVFASIKGATFENKLAGLKSTIQNSIQPEADDFCQTMSLEFGLLDDGLELFMTFDHLPAMQEDEVQMEQAYYYKTQSLSLMLKDGVIGHDQYAKEANVKMDGTGEVISNTPPVLDPANKK